MSDRLLVAAGVAASVPVVLAGFWLVAVLGRVG